MGDARTFFLTVVAMVKNEASYLDEWIAYHNVQGVEHFFLYDNNSTDATREVLRRHVAHGLATVMDWPILGGQTEAFTHAVRLFGPTSEWMAFFDPDEFVVPRHAPDLRTLLEGTDADQVVFPWRMFGFSGHTSPPDGLVTEAYTLAQDIPEGGLPQGLGKPVVRPHAIALVNPHVNGTVHHRTVDPGGNPMVEEVLIDRPSFEHGQLNHYFTKSYSEFAAKIARGQGGGDAEKRLFGPDDQADHNTLDTEIARFVPAAKDRLAALSALSPSPFRYGGQLRTDAFRRDPFQWLAMRAASNHLRGARHLTNWFEPVEHCYVRPNSVIATKPAEVAEVGAFADGIHLNDLQRRLSAVRRWSLDQPITLEPEQDGSSSLEVPLGPAEGLRFHALVALFTATTASGVWCSLDGAEAASSVHVDCAGTYMWLVEVNRHPCPAEQLTIGSGGPGVELRDAWVLVYG